MEDECFGIAQCHGIQPFPGVREFRNSQEPRSSNMFLEFRDSMYSVIPWKSANPISWCRLLGCRPEEKAVNQMIVQEWLPHCQASQCSLHNAPIVRLLLKVAVNGTHQCESLNFCGAPGPVPLTLGGRKRSGAFDAVWPSATKMGAGRTSPRLDLHSILRSFHREMIHQVGLCRGTCGLVAMTSA